MRGVPRPVALAGIGCLLAALAVSSAGAESRVEARDGRISAAFDAVPTAEALAAIQRATGVEIVLPASAQGKTVTLDVQDVPFERLLQRLLETLQLGGYMLVYEPGGTRRVIVVDRSQGTAPPAAGPTPRPPPPKAPPGGNPGTPPAPVYTAPTSPPVYIPPTTPPVYVPPTTPPVYVPPATPPVYVPPAQPPAAPPGR
jgi:hypothetical protein